MSEQSGQLSPEDEARLQRALRRKGRRTEEKYGWPRGSLDEEGEPDEPDEPPRGHALVVSDDPIDAHLFCFLAECEGYAAIEAQTEDEAIAILRSALRPLVVVMPLLSAPSDLTVRTLAAVRDAGDAWARHKLIAFGWYVVPDLEELVAALSVRLVVPPDHATLAAVLDAATAELSAGGGELWRMSW